MNIYFIYLSILLLTFILIYYGLNFGYKYAPFKIKILSVGAFISLALRYIALLIFLINKNIRNMYLLKPIIFLNFISIPILAMISIYIYSRNNKFKFNYCIIFSIILSIFYIFIIFNFQVNINSIKELGYSMEFINNNLIYGIFLILNTLYLFSAIVLLGFKNINTIGICLLLISSIVEIFEIIIKICGIGIFPVPIVGDIFFILCADYALYKLKK
ncbi:hypothetical protein SAMN05428976_106136 [Clostridium sp. USBA 49]|uniref:hypothetical protein n=1 Tax=Clostridium sp. USBA 49 TaxID=1881060 RepID=UPI00099955F8|nr:hypothetical protein [Clostridium sp. USBA 49]SKA84185.1 hypothetical protein SAMN05428976_106136 [Clostridium sp. USBA 49]